MLRTNRPSLTALSALGLCLLLAGCSTASVEAAPSTPTSVAASLPTGTQGAASFDAGFIKLGNGPKRVDLYLDAMCPYCRHFEESNLPQLVTMVRDGGVTLRIHPVAILNRLSHGTNYSTRAGAALLDVAASHPDKVTDFLHTLFEHQPAENTDGLSDAALADLVHTVTRADPGDAATLASYRQWVDVHTRLATAGPLASTTDIRAITQVPTVVVDQHVFTGDVTDPATFTDFLTRN